MALNSDFVWNVSAKCLSENMTHNHEFSLAENSQVTEKRSDFKKLLLAK